MINREIESALAFADWRLDMEEEAYFFEDNMNSFFDQVKGLREEEMACESHW